MNKRISSIKTNSLIFLTCLGSLVLTVFCSATLAETFVKGVDLSYVNKMEDCGVSYRDNGVQKDNFRIMRDHGANVVRVRIWHDPDWVAGDGTTINQYSNYQDAKRSIARAKNLGMKVILDFHYSDEWTDPGHQQIPKAWESIAYDVPALSTEVYNYTYNTLMALNAVGFMPDYVQVGNETNREIMLPKNDTQGNFITGFPIDWTRNSALLNAGIAAVRAAGDVATIDPEIILHIADPNNADWWFGPAVQSGVTDFDIIGLSYYPEWHPGTISEIGDIISALKADYSKEVLIVETGVIFTHDWNDNAVNMMNSASYYTDNGYGIASPEAQANWLIDLTKEVKSEGGLGVVYWEPSWVANSCWTLWGEGSHWENASFFGLNNWLDNELMLDGGIKFLEQNYGNVTFKVDMTGVNGGTGAYITGDFSGATWYLIEMYHEGDNIYSFSIDIPEGTTGAFYFLKKHQWSKRENVPSECALSWGTDRQYTIPSGSTTYAYKFATCETF